MKIFPAVHYSMGGLWVDYNQMTEIPGLFAEVNVITLNMVQTVLVQTHYYLLSTVVWLQDQTQ